ncbi:MAG TPA: hypothetical protein VE130_03855 [Nitrososphaeraceae archaeon]|jgi:hypothetical protein|nr:hypothetical protein [Nitrososphaeraceae archaeon]
MSRILPLDIAIEHALQAWPTYHGGDPNLTDILFLANTIRALSTTIDGATADIIANKNTTIFRVYRQNRIPELTW